MKIYWDQDLIITSFIKDKSFVFNLSSVTNNIAFKVKLVKLTESVKLTSIFINLFNLTKLLIELESSTHNNKLICN